MTYPWNVAGALTAAPPDSVEADVRALKRFEALVLSQQPAVKPWEPVTDYSFEARKAIEGKHPDLILEAFGTGPFLDYGCGPHAILVRLLRDRGAMAYGIDPQLSEQWRCLQPQWDNGPEAFVGHYPVIICREVFEHLTIREIQRTIRRFVDFSPQVVYVTTRLNTSAQHMLDVQTADDLDPTHISMLSPTLLRTLFVLEGFKRRADLEEKMDWQRKGRCLVYERA